MKKIACLFFSKLLCGDLRELRELFLSAINKRMVTTHLKQHGFKSFWRCSMKKLLIYEQEGEFVIEHINSFNHSTKRFYVTENGLFEGLGAYKPVIDQYQLEVSETLWSKVIGFLNGIGF